MKYLIQTIAVTGALAAPVFAQDTPSGAGAALETLTCGEFMALSHEDRATVMLAMRAQLNGDPLPEEPLPIEGDAEAGDAVTEEAAAVGTEVEEPEGEASATAEQVEADSVSDQANEFEAQPTDPKLTAMTTSCEGAPDVLAAEAMRAAHADYE